MPRPALLIVSIALWSAPGSARSVFDGNWIADLDTQSGLASDVYLIRDGIYSCASCEPPRRYLADGRPHPVPGDAAVTSESVTITGPRTIVTHIVEPSLDRVTTMTVAPDDRTATYVSIDHRPGIKPALRTVYLARRTAPALAGAHPVSGTWQGVRYVSVPALVRTTTLRLIGDRFSYSTPLGIAFTALLEGDAVPVGDGLTVAVRRTGRRQIMATWRAGGQPVTIRSFTIATDGRSMEIATTDPLRGTTFRAISRRAGGGSAVTE